MKKNEEFWREVLVGRTITDIKFDTVNPDEPKSNRLDRMTLDNGEEFWINSKGVIGIMDDKEKSGE